MEINLPIKLLSLLAAEYSRLRLFNDKPDATEKFFPYERQTTISYCP